MAKILRSDEIADYIKKTGTWDLFEGKPSIGRTYTFKNFASALRFVNRVGEEAEAMDHHPDISLHDYKVVTLTLTTHEAKTSDGKPASGLTRLDFDLAAKIENAFQELQNLTVNK